MKTKAKNLSVKKIVCIVLTIIIILLIISIYNNFVENDSYATETLNYDDINSVKISNAKEIDIDNIIKQNTDGSKKEDIEVKEEVLEYITKYKTNTELPKGTIQVIQEGQEGIQQISTKKVYENDVLVDEEEIGKKVTKASIDKIVEVGGANYTSTYTVKVGDTIYVTSDRLSVMSEPNNDSTKVATLNRNDELKVSEITDSWYKISCSSTIGWVKQESTTYINPNEEQTRRFRLTKNKSRVIKHIKL